ncbi:7431_t:CDS:2, partial [Paraglomus occultum]
MSTSNSAGGSRLSSSSTFGRSSLALNDLIPTALQLASNTVATTASVVFTPLATRAVKGDTMGIITDLAPAIMDQRRLQQYITGKNRQVQEGSNQSPPPAGDGSQKRLSLLNTEMPESEAPLSLLEGFKASYPDYDTFRKSVTKLKKKKTRGALNGVFDGHDGSSDTASIDGESKPLNQLITDRDRVVRENDRLCAQELDTIAEIKEIEKEIERLQAKKESLSSQLLTFEGRKNELSYQVEELNYKISSFVHVERNGTDEKGRLKQSRDPISILYKIMEFINDPAGFIINIRWRLVLLERRGKRYESGVCFRTLEGHEDVIKCIDFDRPGGFLVSSSLDNTVRVWNLNTNKCVGLLDGHKDIVTCIKIHDNRLITGSKDKSIRQWNLSLLSQSDMLAVLPHCHYKSISSSAKSSFDMTDDDTLENIGETVWVATLEGHSGEITCLHHEDQWLVSGSADKTMKQWDLETGQCILTMDLLWAMSSAKLSHAPLAESFVFDLLDEGDFIGALQFWNYALASGTRDGAILRTGQTHRTLLGHSGTINRIVMPPTRYNELLTFVFWNTGPITSLQFDEYHVVSGSMDKSIRIWDLRTGTIFDTLSYENAIAGLQFDSQRIVCACGVNDIK